MAGDALTLALREPTLGIVECESGARQALVHVREKNSYAYTTVRASRSGLRQLLRLNNESHQSTLRMLRAGTITNDPRFLCLNHTVKKQ